MYILHLALKTTQEFHQIYACRPWPCMARFSSGGVAIRYVLPVLWMTSNCHVMDFMREGKLVWKMSAVKTATMCVAVSQCASARCLMVNLHSHLYLLWTWCRHVTRHFSSSAQVSVWQSVESEPEGGLRRSIPPVLNPGDNPHFSGRTACKITLHGR